jgi:hypothetical protein
MNYFKMNDPDWTGSETVHTLNAPLYGPQKEVILNEKIFLAEYSSLRGEIQQRIAQQTTLYQIAITAFGVIVGYALEKVDAKSWHNSVILVSVYPLLAFLLSFGWTFNQIRICQIAQYLRARERQVSDVLGLLWWENYIIDEPTINPKFKGSFPNNVKNRPGFMILSGTQIASIVLALIVLLINVFSIIDQRLVLNWERIGSPQVSLLLIFVGMNAIITFITFVLIRRSGGV